MIKTVRNLSLAALVACHTAYPAAGQDNGQAMLDRLVPGFAGNGAPARDILAEQAVTDLLALDAVLEANGYARLISAERSGGTWIVEAVRNNGAVHRLRIDAADGSIVSRRKAGWTRVPTPGFGDE
jgi:hypothetical protein